MFIGNVSKHRKIDSPLFHFVSIGAEIRSCNIHISDTFSTKFAKGRSQIGFSYHSNVGSVLVSQLEVASGGFMNLV